MRGFAREIITRVQKLKKKAHLRTEDPVIVFYKFGKEAKHLNAAVESEAKAIANAVKKPFLPLEQHFGLTNIAHDRGTIDEEEYHLQISAPGPIFNFPLLSESFGPSGEVLARALMTYPYSKVKSEKHFTIKLDGTPQTLE